MKKNLRTISVAESCTGGLLGSIITTTPGSSDYFLGGVICYHNKIKTKFLKVPASDIKKHGAVSEVVAKKMAQGVRRVFGSYYGVSITGVAGPAGGSKDKPVGTVFIALASPTRTLCKKFLFKGSRARVRAQAAKEGLQLLR